MTMESPVRICLGAVLVVNLLLLISTTVKGNALPESTATTIKDETTRLPRFRTNATWVGKKTKTPDVALNELNPKDSVSEENTDKNDKYKQRGRVKFHSQTKSSTESSLRRVRTSSTESAESAKLVIVTPTPEVKRPSQIIDSMRSYKKTKMPVVSSSTMSTVTTVKKNDGDSISEKQAVKTEGDNAEAVNQSAKTEDQSEEYEEYEDDEEEDKSSEKYTGKFNDHFFTIPTYNDDFSQSPEGTDNKVKSSYSRKPFDSFPSYFPETYGSKEDNESFKAESFFDFETELTTPKNDFFDKKFQEISKSIISNLASIKAKAPPPNATKVYTIVEENGKLSTPTSVTVKDDNTRTPTNKSRVIIKKNTKEIRLLDNDEAGTNPTKGLSDVHGTSIYYEMSVLSTETYNINSSDDDCDNDTLPEPTASTSSEEEQASIKSTASTLTSVSTKPTKIVSEEAISTLSTNYFPFSSVSPTFFSSPSPVPYSIQNSVSSSTGKPIEPVISTQGSISSTEKTTRVYSSSYSRNRNYSKRLNLNGIKDSPNSVTIKTDQTISNQNYRLPTRKFHYTTPKNKPIWMAPRRNVTRTSYTRSTPPTTIYSEYFSIKDKLTTTPKPIQPARTTLTTVSSEIDPVLQSDVGGIKKIVHSQSISDNSIPTLWKRGSTKFSSSTAASMEDTESGTSDLEIPPTLTAWALASMRSPPGSGPIVNSTVSTQKSIDENELQKVGEVTDKKEAAEISTTTTANVINNDIIPKKVTDIDQNRLPWRPVFAPTAPTKAQSVTTVTESKSEISAESNISVQSSVQPSTTTESMKPVTEPTVDTEATENTRKANTQTWMSEVAEKEVPPVDATKSTGFESITKFPAGLTTPRDVTASSSGEQTQPRKETVPTTTDYEITTIRFSYVPTEAVSETEPETSTTPAWHPVFPTRTKATTIKDEPITTYRPKYITSTEYVEETTTYVPETTPQLEVSSQVIENATEVQTEATTVAETTTQATSILIESTTEPTVMPSSTTKELETTTIEHEETTTITVEVVTEINTERERPQSTSTEISMSTEISSNEVAETLPSEIRTTGSASEENSGSNEVITQENKSTTTTVASKVETNQTTKEVEEPPTTERSQETTQVNGKISVTTVKEDSTADDGTTRSDMEDFTTYTSEMTTEASSRVLTEESNSGAAVAIAVSTIGVIALVMLVGLLLVVRRRSRRGVYAQRCTPVSLDAYSLDSVSVGHRKGNHRLRASKRSYGNPAYDDEVTSHPMQYAALSNFSLDVDSMSAEFAEIPSVSVRPDEVPPGCEDKNRYSNVLPLPETRVPLRRIGNDPTTEYINANFITGPGNIKNYYVACQAPLANTVVDFWRMMWEHNSRVVVMLTEYMENGVEKCYEYLPPSEVSDNKRTFGEFKIVLMKREQHDKYAISSVQLINLSTRTWREVTHLWYFWPAKGVPDDYDSIIDFLSEMRSYMKLSQTAKEYDEEGIEVIYGDQSRSSFHNLSKLRSEDGSSGNGVNVYSPARAEEQLRRGTVTNGTLGRMKAASEVEGVRPCVVVCASGAGRSAAIIAVDICARALAAGAADVPRVVRELRAQRPHSLSNKHHYIFLYKVLSEYGNKLMGGVDTI